MDIETHNELETKAGIPLDAVVTHGEIMRAFEAFKETNDQRHRKTQSTVRKFKDSAGNYLWQPPAVACGHASLMTFAVREAEDMPDIAANSYSIAFGDFNRGYLVVDRAGVTVLRDPYTAKPYVLFYTTKRVGGGVQDFDSIKLMKFAAS